jgi:hypothetical protein
MIEQCKIGSCYCFVCKNGTNLFGTMTNYVGGRCYFETNCTKTRAANLSSNKETPDLSIRQFMIGQGPTFSDFSAANPYCSHRLSMAVQWLVATNESPYTLPDPSRVMCFLSKDIIPVYVLYSNGEDINDTRAKKIAEILGTEGDDLFMGKLSSGPVGPVIVVTEMDFNESDADKVANQVKAINDACNNRQQDEVYCMVAVAPKINDFKALDAVMAKVDKDEVDFVAFGVNGNYVQSCEGPKIMNQVLNFSQYSLYKYGKPTVIPYIMFDTQGSDIGNTCTWSESKMMSAYSSFFPRGILSLQERGVIGVAPYSFNSTSYGVSNPLKCIDCAVGKNEQRLKSWYSWCQSFTNITRKLPTGASTSHPSGMLTTIFPNESGGSCDHNAQIIFCLRCMHRDPEHIKGALQFPEDDRNTRRHMHKVSRD